MIRGKEKAYWFLKGNGAFFVIALLSLLIIAVINFINYLKTGLFFIDFLDWTVFFAITISLILEKTSSLLSNVLLRKLEDSAKITLHYAELVRKYPRTIDNIDFIRYNNEFAARENVAYILKKRKPINASFPVTCDYMFHDKPVCVDDEKNKFYILPELIKQHNLDLFESHLQSNVYNQMNIRVDYWEERENEFYIHTSRTTYYDSLLTNRAIDYKWNNAMAIRDIYQYGPFLPQLKTSVLSNHLGFTGFIVSSDGYIPFVKRNDNVSIGKATYGDSIGASMKVKYAVDSQSQLLTEEGIIESIYCEINDEIKLTREQLKCIVFGKIIICAYRDFVEGGKPQLLFYVESELTMKEINNQFKRKCKESSAQKKRNKHDTELKELEDGNKLLWINENELDNMAILPEGIVFRGRFYSMMPSASASIVMLLDWKSKYA